MNLISVLFSFIRIAYVIKVIIHYVLFGQENCRPFFRAVDFIKFLESVLGNCTLSFNLLCFYVQVLAYLIEVFVLHFLDLVNQPPLEVA
jgi:hypothetical protein